MKILFLFLSFCWGMSSYGVKTFEIDCVYPYTLVYKKLPSGRWQECIHIYCFDSGSTQSEPIYFALQSQATEDNGKVHKARKIQQQFIDKGYILGDKVPAPFNVEKDLGSNIWKVVGYIVCIPYTPLLSFIKQHKDLLQFNSHYGPLRIIDYRAVVAVPPQSVLGAFTGVNERLKFQSCFERSHYLKEWDKVEGDTHSLIKILATQMENLARTQYGVRFVIEVGSRGAITLDGRMCEISYMDANQIESELPFSLKILCNNYKDACYREVGMSPDPLQFINNFVEAFYKAYEGKSYHFFESPARQGDFSFVVMAEAKNLEGSTLSFDDTGEVESMREGSNPQEVVLEYLASYSFLAASKDLDYISSDGEN